MGEAGPTERTQFFDFQARNRRATWRLTVAYLVVVGVGGFLSAVAFVGMLFLVLFALVFVPAVVCLGLGALAMLSPVTAPLTDPLWTIPFIPLDIVARLPKLLPGEEAESLWALGLLLPLGCGLAVRSVWLAAGVGHALLAMGARPPRPDDPEERQLVNVVHEMAIAAGIATPEVRLLDAGAANAAVAGTEATGSYVIVGRRLLDEFDRDETQGILGHLIGSIGNGDLRGAAQIHSLLYVLELLIVVVLAPFARVPRRIVWRWLTFALWAAGRASEARDDQARALMDLLRDHRRRFAQGGDDPVTGLGGEYFGWLGRILIRVCPPLLALYFLAQAATGFLLLFASLPVGLLWRSRRYLADATAVGLMRSPTGLHRGLRRLENSGATTPGGGEVAHLFIVGPEGDRKGTFAEREGLLVGMHPKLSRRLRRLERMGAVTAERR
jgi:Zn-dependent protease with chaperone function